MASIVRGADALQSELERARESLKDVDENIKKLTGRDPADNRPGARRLSASADLRGSRDRGTFNVARRGLLENSGRVGPIRRPLGTAFSRLGPRPRSRSPRRDSGDEEELPNKPTVQSSVVATSQENRSRTDSIKQLNKDVKGRQRNRRMFGNLLVGTLLKFQDEAKVKTDIEHKRKEVEQKLEQKARDERDELRKERQQLFNNRRQQQAKMRRLEQKLALVELHAQWEQETRKLGLFARTKVEPYIYFKPKKITEEVKKKIEDSAKAVEVLICERKRKLEEEIEELMRQDENDQHGIDGENSDNEMEEGGGEEGEVKEQRSRKNSEHLKTEETKMDADGEERQVRMRVREDSGKKDGRESQGDHVTKRDGRGSRASPERKRERRESRGSPASKRDRRESQGSPDARKGRRESHRKDRRESRGSPDARKDRRESRDSPDRKRERRDRRKSPDERRVRRESRGSPGEKGGRRKSQDTGEGKRERRVSGKSPRRERKRTSSGDGTGGDKKSEKMEEGERKQSMSDDHIRTSKDNTENKGDGETVTNVVEAPVNDADINMDEDRERQEGVRAEGDVGRGEMLMEDEEEGAKEEIED